MIALKLTIIAAIWLAVWQGAQRGAHPAIMAAIAGLSTIGAGIWAGKDAALYVPMALVMAACGAVLAASVREMRRIEAEQSARGMP